LFCETIWSDIITFYKIYIMTLGVLFYKLKKFFKVSNKYKNREYNGWVDKDGWELIVIIESDLLLRERDRNFL